MTKPDKIVIYRSLDTVPQIRKDLPRVCYLTKPGHENNGFRNHMKRVEELWDLLLANVKVKYDRGVKNLCLH